MTVVSIFIIVACSNGRFDGNKHWDGSTKNFECKEEAAKAPAVPPAAQIPPGFDSAYPPHLK